MSFSKENFKSATFYENNYKVIAEYDFAANQHIVLKDHNNSREQFCRFCGRNNREVSFKQTTHAIPELLGNKSIISHNECDECNSFFARKYEDHLAKRFMIELIVGRVLGKKGIPTYENGKIRINARQGLHIELKENYNIVDDISGEIKLPPLNIQKHIPINVAKAFIKAICSILPKEELAYCKKTIEWLLNKKRSSFASFPILNTFIPGPPLFSSGKVKIVRRTNDGENPYIWGIFFVGNYVYQVMLPFCEKDKWIKFDEKNTFNIRYYPLPISDKYCKRYGQPKFTTINLAEESKVNISTGIISFSSISDKKLKEAIVPLSNELCLFDASITVCVNDTQNQYRLDNFVATFDKSRKIISLNHSLAPLCLEFPLENSGENNGKMSLQGNLWQGLSILELPELDFLYHFNLSKNTQIEIQVPNSTPIIAQSNTCGQIKGIETLYKFQKICQIINEDFLSDDIIEVLHVQSAEINRLYNLLTNQEGNFNKTSAMTLTFEGTDNIDKIKGDFAISNLKETFSFLNISVVVDYKIQVTNPKLKVEMVDNDTKVTVRQTCNSKLTYELISWEKSKESNTKNGKTT